MNLYRNKHNRWRLLGLMSNTSAQCSMDNIYVQWTFAYPLDPMVNDNVQWTFECQMAILAALSWVLLTGDYHTAEENVFIGFIGFIGSNGQWQCPMDI